MSPSGLHSFMGGTAPHYSTIRKVTNWYVRETRRDPTSERVATIEAAIGLLVEHLPMGARNEAREGVIEVIRKITHKSGTEQPSWMDHVSRSEAG